ncbi:MAG TPA: SDR family oxidoreductase [Anaeromyxobacteraceae bacterium]|jgi:NAD(P)-dependent dehydrogenase (short-subunit alcohol dehydrogenase family)|nr:SDR family oxidoreductase [Anaeromyxobacteraceae bacterium]
MGTSLRDNVVVLTGASSGIGRALALELAKEGARLVLAARNLSALETVAGECRARGACAVAHETDVAEKEQCRELVERAVAEHGRIDTVVHNAGVSMWARFDEIADLGILDRLMRVNYFGPVYLTYYALPWLERSRGRIVAISSVAGVTGYPTRCGYSASKHALVGFFDTLRIELAPKGITVTVVYPGFVTSSIRERAFGPDGKPLGRSPVREWEGMSAEQCARLTVNAIVRRNRDLYMTAHSWVARWLRRLAPRAVDRMAARSILYRK